MEESVGDSDCQHCASTNIEVDYTMGQSEQELITNSVQYEKGASGRNTLVGRNINLGTDGYTGQTGNPLKGGIARSSKDATMSRNDDRLRGLASQSKCGPNECAAAFRIYKMAYDVGMIPKRPIDIVLSSCLIIASRQLKTGYMLADFVPYIPGDMFDLAKSVRFLVTRLYITVPIQSPDHQVERFCYKLVEDKVLVQKLITMARRTVQRMHN